MDIEKLATSAVESAIAKTDRLSGFINSGDKEPVWDGNIYIHQDKQKTKINIKRVPVQVKGKVVQTKPPKCITYRIDAKDMDGYLNNAGGAIFFVVYIDKSTATAKQIYYATLLPLKIMELQKSYTGKHTIPVSFKAYPDDPIEQTELFLNFHSDSQKQASFAGKDLPTVANLMQQGLLDSLSFHYTKLGGKITGLNLPSVMRGKSLSLYAKVKGLDTLIPVEYFEDLSQMTTRQEYKVPVKVGTKQFYDHVDVVSTAENLIVHIGSCAKICIPNNEIKNSKDRVRITFKTAGTLNQRITAFEFLVALRDKKGFSIGNENLNIHFKGKDAERLQIDSWPEMLQSYYELRDVLEKLGIGKDLTLDDLPKEDYYKLSILIEAIGKQKTVDGLQGNYPSLINLHVGNINALLFAKQNEDNSFSVSNFFDIKLDTKVEIGGIGYPVSQFAMLKAEHFVSADNMDLQRVVSDLKEVTQNEASVNHANTVMLEMLKAYDQQNNPRLLEACTQLANWLVDLHKFLSEEITAINTLQIIARQRKLTYGEKQRLNKIIEATTDIPIKIGAFLLLDEQEEAMRLLCTLEDSARSNFSQYPIAKFIKADEEVLL